MTQVFIGTELLASANTALDQVFPQITALSESGYVVTWTCVEGAPPPPLAKARDAVTLAKLVFLTFGLGLAGMIAQIVIVG